MKISNETADKARAIYENPHPHVFTDRGDQVLNYYYAWDDEFEAWLEATKSPKPLIDALRKQVRDDDDIPF